MILLEPSQCLVLPALEEVTQPGLRDVHQHLAVVAALGLESS